MAENSSPTSKQRTKVIYGPMDTTFLVIVLVLVSLGLIMMFSASYANAFYLKNNSLFYISRQLPFALMGITVMIMASHVDYRIFKPLSLPLYGITLILLVIALFMPPLNNARRWIFIGPFNFQPSEIAKFAIVILFASLICANFQQMKTVRYGIAPFAAALAPVAFLMLKEPHLSGTVLILSLGIVMMFIGGTDARWFVAGAIVATIGIAAVIFNPSLLTSLAHYAGDRITVWLDPFSDPKDKGFQTVQSLYAIASGGLMGTGIGASRQKYLYLPEPYNDFIFAIVCEELGFVGAALIICLFALLVWRGFVIASRCPDRFGALVAAGLTAQVGIQTLLNIAVVTNSVPNTGISLPFFSYGGTSLLMLLGEMGIILSISRTAAIQKV
ncbi:MAG: cell cycle protein [Oscillospiraceae bacterium]|jgi:cell division protein FtsW|nr:cell cycle protein [Oscillospiraceae bacterium]